MVRLRVRNLVVQSARSQSEIDTRERINFNLMTFQCPYCKGFFGLEAYNYHVCDMKVEVENVDRENFMNSWTMSDPDMVKCRRPSKISVICKYLFVRRLAIKPRTSSYKYLWRWQRMPKGYRWF